MSELSTTYHEMPVLKEPVWKAWIPTYFFVGGVAGVSAALGATADLVAARRRESGSWAQLVRSARTVAALGCVASAGLLIADLGRPARFLHMLRVFRPTSPMNVGTWILSAAGAATTASVLLPRRLARASGLVAGPLGLAMTSYTAVLLANTAVPVWLHGRRTLPPLFVASAAGAAADVLELASVGRGGGRRAVRVLGAVGKVAELAAGFAYERELSGPGPVVVRALRTGRAGALWQAARLATAASVVLARLGEPGRVAGALVGLAGSLALRFAVVAAGKASARDPRATFEPQRARVGRTIEAGAPAIVVQGAPAFAP
jgi:hypothetical protein